MMAYLAEAGFPVPRVYHASGPDLVMERLAGRDMLTDLSARPWLVRQHARTLASLHDRLHAIAAPPSLRAQSGPGDRMMHPRPRLRAAVIRLGWGSGRLALLHPRERRERLRDRDFRATQVACLQSLRKTWVAAATVVAVRRWRHRPSQGGGWAVLSRAR